MSEALEVAGYFRLDNKKAYQIIEHAKTTVSSWRAVDVKYKISKAEQDGMSVAFSVEE